MALKKDVGDTADPAPWILKGWDCQERKNEDGMGDYKDMLLRDGQPTLGYGRVVETKTDRRTGQAFKGQPGLGRHHGGRVWDMLTPEKLDQLRP